MEDINGSEMSAIPVNEPTAPGSEVIMARDGIRTPERLAVDGREQPSGGTIGDASGSAAMSTAVVKRKRGRPKKTEMPAISASLFSGAAALQPPKRGRGRPRGSGKLQLLPWPGGNLIETVGENFDIQVVTVHFGEDIISKILSFSQAGESVCVVSATGAVSTVVIGQPGSSCGTLRFEGLFEVLSLKGLLSSGAGVPVPGQRPNFFSILLAKPDGRVFGGCLAGPLVAAGPVQLVVGTFKECIPKEWKVGRSRKSPVPATSTAANPDQALVTSGNVFNGTLLLGDGSCEIPSSAGLESMLDAAEHHSPEDN